MFRVRIAVLLAIAGALVWIGSADQIAESSSERIMRQPLEAGMDSVRAAENLRPPRVPASDMDPAVAAKAEEFANEALDRWTSTPCPTGGSTAEAFFDPQPYDADAVLDLDPGPDWQGYDVVRVADIALPDGVMLESDGIALGDGGGSVRITEPGTYPFFMALSRRGGRSAPSLGQLVFDADSEPVRWVSDERFGFGTDSGTGWLGSPGAALVAPTSASDLDFATWSRVGDVLSQFPGVDDFCISWQRDDGVNFVHYNNGWGDGFFPGAAGYDAADNLVAITWFYRTGPWLLAGIPGTPPVEVQQQYAAN